MTAICQKILPDAPWVEPRTRRLPGVQPLEPGDWITVDDAYGAQMTERARLLEERPNDVLKCTPEAGTAAAELYKLVLEHLAGRADFVVTACSCKRPDGVVIALDPSAPLKTLCHLVTEDFCILQKTADEHVLTAALLCFPASWTLAEKFAQPLGRIHAPVNTYDSDMAKRVQRLFDAVQPGKPLWRANAMQYCDPSLYQPRPENDPRTKRTLGHYIRSEKQCILRLPKTQAVVFSIHTRQVPLESLTAAQAEALQAHPIDHDAAVTDE